MYLLIGLYAAHVIGAIVWFGGGLTSLLVVGPALGRSSGAARAEVGPNIAVFAKRVYPLAGIVTIGAGIALAIAGGRFTSPADVATAYGVTVACASALAVGVYVWGGAVVGPAMARVGALPPAERPAALARGIRMLAFEQCGFAAVFACMVLMRFGV